MRPLTYLILGIAQELNAAEVVPLKYVIEVVCSVLSVETFRALLLNPCNRRWSKEASECPHWVEDSLNCVATRGSVSRRSMEVDRAKQRAYIAVSLWGSAKNVEIALVAPNSSA